MAENQRSLPCALEAEQSVLGSILIDPNCFADLTEIIRGEDFYLEEHGEIFYAMYDLFSKNREIDLVTLIDTLVSRGIYNEEESKKYIKIIAETVPSLLALVSELVSPFTTREIVNAALLLASEDCTLMTPF